ncbi:hypothetical protein B0H17DRAFT_1136519 [Mycena rosella]|uniref:Uncharacterized protein n=1 Tax=Mycena rosella TaxID=1033263 RepID=A0AAD7GEC7_MYCRO|nr:hypothetical protein B0H17DRAFT_1136519 [Mycena rosella]
MEGALRARAVDSGSDKKIGHLLMLGLGLGWDHIGRNGVGSRSGSPRNNERVNCTGLEEGPLILNGGYELFENDNRSASQEQSSPGRSRAGDETSGAVASAIGSNCIISAILRPFNIEISCEEHELGDISSGICLVPEPDVGMHYQIYMQLEWPEFPTVICFYGSIPTPLRRCQQALSPTRLLRTLLGILIHYHPGGAFLVIRTVIDLLDVFPTPDIGERSQNSDTLRQE